MKRHLLTSLFILLVSCKLFAQKSPQLLAAGNTDQSIDQIRNNKAIDADSAFSLLSGWNKYPSVKNTGIDYIYYYTDSLYGKIPLCVYIPSAYINTHQSPCVIMLHGAVGLSKFNDIDSLNKFDDDVLFSTLKKQDYIIIRPVADKKKGFDWVVNRFYKNAGNTSNQTYRALTGVLISLKKVLNIDDNRVFALGHSDGSDGTIGFGVYTPNVFAGFVAYNSMLNNVFATDFYIRNIINRPLYLVHSDLDDLRPIQQTRIIVDGLSKIDNNILYKEYIGYQHQDEHLNKDIPYAIEFINGQSRNAFKTNVYWETDKTDQYNSCDWLKITTQDTTAQPAAWYVPFNFKTYNKNTKKWEDLPYYYSLKKSMAVKASYNNNVFNVQTTGVSEIQLFISPVMVNLENPVIVIVNNKRVFEGKIKADKNFLLTNFKDNFDRKVLWVMPLKVKVQ
ncbi:MAG: hypothetical protein JWR38_1990 [Mucilaginibacter sp.]|nr:hypothetical protein [Mucilaginibacter sp.]